MAAITVTSVKTYVRPSTSVPWAEDTPEYLAYFQANYIDTGLITLTTTLSPDQLTKTITFRWNSPFEVDPTWPPGTIGPPELIDETMLDAKEAREAYMELNGIQFTNSVTVRPVRPVDEIEIRE